MTGVAGQWSRNGPFRLGISLTVVNAWQSTGRNAGVADAVAVGTVAGLVVTAVSAKRVEGIEIDFTSFADMPRIAGSTDGGGCR